MTTYESERCDTENIYGFGTGTQDGVPECATFEPKDGDPQMIRAPIPSFAKIFLLTDDMPLRCSMEQYRRPDFSRATVMTSKRSAQGIDAALDHHHNTSQSRNYTFRNSKNNSAWLTK